MRLVYVRDTDGKLREQFETMGAPSIESLDLESSLALLRTNVIGRVGFLRQDHPILLPVTYGLDRDDNVVFRTAPGSKLWVAENERVSAAFEVDEYDDAGRGSGVVVHGPMRPVTDLIDARRLDDLGVEPWADAVERPRWIRVQPLRIEGWTLSGR